MPNKDFSWRRHDIFPDQFCKGSAEIMPGTVPANRFSEHYYLFSE